MNTAFGPESELPFDLRHRRFPIGYSIAADRSDKAHQQDRLSSTIEAAVRAALESRHERVNMILSKLDGVTRYFMREHGQHDKFWETGVESKGLPGNTTFAIRSLLEWELIEAVQFSNDSTSHAFRWTYLGSLCLKALNYQSVHEIEAFHAYLGPPNVIMDSPALDFAPGASNVTMDLSTLDFVAVKPNEAEGMTRPTDASG